MPDKVDFAKGTILFEEGADDPYLYIVESGLVEVYLTRLGTDTVVSQVGPSGFLGTVTFVNGGTRTASARAKVDTRAVRIRADEMERMKKTAPVWLLGMIRDLTFRLAELDHAYLQTVLTMSELHKTTRKTNFLAIRQMVVAIEILGALMPQDYGAIQGVRIDELLPRLAVILSLDEADLASDFPIFGQAGLFTIITGNDGHRYIAAADFATVKSFNRVIAAWSASDVALCMRERFGPKEEEALLAVAAIARDRAAHGPINLDKLADAYKAKSGNALFVPNLEKGARANIIDIDRSHDIPLVRIDPEGVEAKLMAIRVLKYFELREQGLPVSLAG